MSKLEKWIKKLCPNGVEYKELNTLVDYIQPTKYIVKSTKYNDEYDIPVLTPGQTFILGYTNEKEGIYNADKENPIILFDDFTTAFRWINFKFKVKSSAVKILIPKNNNINFKYVFYTMQTIKFDNTQHNRQWISKYSILKIPVPPIEVQNEIVRILDNFTELEEELEEELEARKKQYEHYRDELIKNNSNANYQTLEEIATDMYRGSGIKRNEVTESGISCVRYGEIYTTYNVTFDKCISHTDEEKITSKKYFEYGDVLFAITGESVEEIGKSIVYLGNEKCLAGGDIVVMKHKQNPKYLAFALSTTNAQVQKSKGKIKSKVVHSSVPALKEILIPIPSLEEQENIANKLEKFYQLCNDISQGLPAEIEARRKQYEYYRDKLLTFKEIKNG